MFSEPLCMRGLRVRPVDKKRILLVKDENACTHSRAFAHTYAHISTPRPVCMLNAHSYIEWATAEGGTLLHCRGNVQRL